MFEKGYRVELYEGDTLVLAIIAEPVGEGVAAAVGVYFDDPEHLEVLHATLRHATESLGFTAWKQSRGATFEYTDVFPDEVGDIDDIDDIPF